jgi:hypothetical protein
LNDLLGPRALLEYVVLEGEVTAIAVRMGRARLHHLGPLTAIEPEINQFRFFLQRSIRPGASEASIQAATAGLAVAGANLGRALVAPLRIEEEEVVVIPTGRLHSVIWPAISYLDEHAVTVAPSASWWAQARQRPPVKNSGTALLVAGPAADHELETLQYVYPEAQMIKSAKAQIAAVTGALRDASLAHFAAHGRFRADNPLFSSLLMADGPLMVHDLETIESLPETVVLSACDAALSDVGRGDELTGLAAGLMMIGVRTLVAPSIPVPDREVGAVMLELHRALRAGQAAPHALRSATQSLGQEGPRAAAIARAFICLGA